MLRGGDVRKGWYHKHWHIHSNAISFVDDRFPPVEDPANLVFCRRRHRVEPRVSCVLFMCAVRGRQPRIILGKVTKVSVAIPDAQSSLYGNILAHKVTVVFDTPTFSDLSHGGVSDALWYDGRGAKTKTVSKQLPVLPLMQRAYLLRKESNEQLECGSHARRNPQCAKNVVQRFR